MSNTDAAMRRMRRLALLSLLVWIVFTPGVPVRGGGGAYQPHWLTLVDTHITDNGDGDGFADTNETLWIEISLVPNHPEGLSDCVARLSADSPAIDCMRKPEILLGDLPVAGPAVTPEERFEITIGDIDRNSLGLGPDDPLNLTLFLDISCAERSWFVPAEITLPVDLDVSNLGQTPVPWVEDFEGGTLGLFSPQNNDAGLPGASDAEGLENADGWRCQYSDPDWVNSSTYLQAAGSDCFPGMNLAQANAVFWRLDGAGMPSPDGGRAKSGTRSMYYGIFLDHASDTFTTPMATVEAVGTTNPVNLGTQAPKLSFWHQVSLADHRMPVGGGPYHDEAAFDRGVVQIQLTDAADAEPGNWMNLVGAVNSYASSDAEVQFNCMFDPIDDGNSEDDFFNPTDPDRRSGPSSTCFGARVWAHQGDTSPAAFDVSNVGNATTPPAPSDAPSLGDGTWVRAELDLTEFRGRVARFRFLVASIKASEETYYEQFGDNGAFDDGWWIDDIVIDETLDEPAVFRNDAFLLGSCSGTGEPCIGQCRWSLAPCSDTNPCDEGEGDCVIPCPPGDVCSGPPPDCGADCTEVQVNVLVEPDGPFNPESVTIIQPANWWERWVELNASAWFDAATGAEPSWADACIDGYLEYRACVTGDPDGDGSGLPDADCDDAWDSIVPWWDPVWRLDPRVGVPLDVITTFAFEVRCSSVPGCRDGRLLEIVVECPSGEPNTVGLQGLRALDKGLLTWRGPLDVDWLRGSFSTSEEIGDYTEDFVDAASSVTSIPMAGDPAAGSGYYYLIKADGALDPLPDGNACDGITWRSGGEEETSEPARDDAFGDP